MNEHDETILSTIGVDADSAYGAVMPPLYMSSNYSFVGYGEKRQFDYGRSGNPTRALLATAIAKLERGAGAIVTSSGMAAVDLVLSLLKPDAFVIAPHDCYGGTWRLLTARAKKNQLRVVFVDQNDADAFGRELAKKPDLVWIETPSNPVMRIVDVAAAAKRAKAAGALVAVDNTFLSPLLQKPIPLGADFVVHSTTKYLNGHSDIVGGAVIAADQAHVEELGWWANCCGVTASPFDSWLTLRGLRTLSVRLQRQQESAGRIAAELAKHAAVLAVHYPGLASHPGHATAKAQQSGFGAMLSFELADPAAVPALLKNIRRLVLAESLGGVESLIAHPSSMTHAAMSDEAKANAGVTAGLLRLSIGLEHADDLLDDLKTALNAVSKR